MHEELAPRMMSGNANERAVISPPGTGGTVDGRDHTLRDFTRPAGKSPERQAKASPEEFAPRTGPGRGSGGRRAGSGRKWP
jgi:hypothetical protein